MWGPRVCEGQWLERMLGLDLPDYQWKKHAARRKVKSLPLVGGLLPAVEGVKEYDRLSVEGVE